MFTGVAVFIEVAGFTAAARSIAVVWFVVVCCTAPLADIMAAMPSVATIPIRHAGPDIMAAPIAVASIAAVLPIEVASTAEEASTGVAESLTIVAPAVEGGSPVMGLQR